MNEKGKWIKRVSPLSHSPKPLCSVGHSRRWECQSLSCAHSSGSSVCLWCFSSGFASPPRWQSSLEVLCSPPWKPENHKQYEEERSGLQCLYLIRGLSILSERDRLLSFFSPTSCLSQSASASSSLLTWSSNHVKSIWDISTWSAAPAVV